MSGEAARRLMADNPAVVRRMTVAIDVAIEQDVAKALDITPRMARALLRSTGRI